MKLDILAFGVHPDDVELGCGGTLISQIQKGYTVGIIDLTRGELGTRGTPEIRDAESLKAKEIIGAVIRENLQLRDGFFQNDEASQIKTLGMIRKYQPEIILCSAIYDRHPDHGRASQLIEDAVFLSGLLKIKTIMDGEQQDPWRPKNIYHYIQDRYIKPDFVVDVSSVWDKKMQSIQAHASQFFQIDADEPNTYIASKVFWENITSRAMESGRACGFLYAEGFTCNKTIGATNIFHLS
ncbi:MAG: bacillithiol biosynthesis deacetylase BshB1 [Chitinophagales bacterium]|nr:bacillithiol biosynthesis deacetylase BshB1 [Chitinophagales bacterium]